MTATITALRTRLLRPKLARNWGHDVPYNHFIVVEIETSDGGVGTGFSWTPAIGAEAIVALLENDIRPFVLHKHANAAELWPRLWEHLHEAGSGGLVTIAMAGLDLALWDYEARTLDQSLVDRLGRHHDRVQVYGSGINLHYSEEKLLKQVDRWLAAGFDTIKIKVGKKDIFEDLDRVAAVRERIGPDRTLALDANQRWDRATAAIAIAALAESDPAWIEEPLRADDTPGYAALRKAVHIPIALGENAHTTYRFRDLLDAGACDVIQPNVIRVGGITPFLQIAELARSRGVRLMPHLLPQLSGQLALALPEATMVEDVEDASFDDLDILASPSGVTIADGWLTADTAPGLGFRFRDKLVEEPHEGE
jgi:L-alanine-DL-glutamate epimerase-like enolase superfamily enzyme